MEPVRKKRRRITPLQEAQEAIQEQLCSPSYLEVRDFGPKGRGIITRKPLQKGDFVTYYHGKHTDCVPDDDTYYYEIAISGKEIWIDGSVEDGSFGRLLNDSQTPNLNPKRVDIEGKPYVAFFAVCEVAIGEELMYNYGESAAYWWRDAEKEKKSVKKRKGNDHEKNKQDMGRTKDPRNPKFPHIPKLTTKDQPMYMSVKTAASSSHQSPSTKQTTLGQTDAQSSPQSPSTEQAKFALGQKDALSTPKSPSTKQAILGRVDDSSTSKSPSTKQAKLQPTYASSTSKSPSTKQAILGQVDASSTPQSPSTEQATLGQRGDSSTPKSPATEQTTLGQTDAPSSPQSPSTEQAKFPLGQKDAPSTPKSPSTKQAILGQRDDSSTPKSPFTKQGIFGQRDDSSTSKSPSTKQAKLAETDALSSSPSTEQAKFALGQKDALSTPKSPSRTKARFASGQTDALSIPKSPSRRQAKFALEQTDATSSLQTSSTAPSSPQSPSTEQAKVALGQTDTPSTPMSPSFSPGSPSTNQVKVASGQTETPHSPQSPSIDQPNIVLVHTSDCYLEKNDLHHTSTRKSNTPIKDQKDVYAWEDDVASTGDMGDKREQPKFAFGKAFSLSNQPTLSRDQPNSVLQQINALPSDQAPFRDQFMLGHTSDCNLERNDLYQSRARKCKKPMKDPKDVYNWEDDVASTEDLDDDRDEDFVLPDRRDNDDNNKDDDNDDDEDDDDDDDDDHDDADEVVERASKKAKCNRQITASINTKENCPTGSSDILERQNEDDQPTPTSDQAIDILNLYKNITIQATSNGKNRSWDKIYYCLFCEKPQKKLPRHLTTQHKQEPQVIDYQLETDLEMKKVKLAKMRNMGNHKHNCDVFRNLKGELIVGYRPRGHALAGDYGPCETCYIYLVRTELWKHKCPVKDLTPAGETGKRKRRPATTSKLMIPTPQGISPHVHELLLKLNDDEIGRAIRLDSLLLELARREYLNHGHDVDQHNDIRQTLRRMGRLLLELRKETQLSQDMEAFIDPRHFQNVLAAARAVGGFEDGTNRFSKASVTLKIGHTLKRLACIIKSKGMECFDEEMERKANKFKELCEINWTEEISRNALRNLNDNKRNKVKVLPFTEDIVCMSQYLKKQSERYAEDLQSEINTVASWKELNRILLARLILFNRKRSGEAAKMKLDDYTKRPLPTGQKVVLDGLTPIEQELCRSLHRIEIVGKRERAVPVLLSKDMVNAIDLLIEKRSVAGVNPNNPFLFPRLHYGSLSHIRGCDCLRELAEESGCKSPTLMRSTGLRKQIATVSQIVNLKENELDILATFLGHDIRTHRHFYRLPEETLQVAKVSKLLLASERGLSDIRGKTLDEIEINMDEEVDGEDFIADLEKQVEDEDREEAIDDIENPEDPGQSGHARDAIPDAISKAVPRGGSKHAVRVPWSTEEKRAVMKHLGKFISQNKLPGKKEIDDCIRAEPILNGRAWRKVKDFCRNKMLQKDPLQI